MNYYNSSASNPLAILPPQKLKSSEKNEDWKKACVNAICAKGYFRFRDNRSIRDNKISNYNLLKGYLTESEYNYVLNPYNVKDAQVFAPAEMRNYNIIYNKFNYILGKELERPFNYFTMAVNGEAVNEMDKHMIDKLLENIEAAALQAIGQQPLDSFGNPITPKEPEQVQKEVFQTFKSAAEIMSNDLLEYLYKDLNLKQKFNKGWSHCLISGEEIYYIGLLNGEPHVRTVNPIYFEFDRGPDTDNIEECQWAREDRFMTPSQVIDEFGEFLTEDEIDSIDKFRTGNYTNVSQMPGFVYRTDDADQDGVFSAYDNSNFILVSICTWKSMRKIGFLKYIDVETEEEIEEIIYDDTFNLTKEQKEAGYELDWRWVTEVWEGVKVGTNIFPYIKPLPIQVNSFDLTESKLPYVGSLYNSLNTKSTSWVDMVKPHQVLYNIIMFRLELEIAKAKGKKFIMDLAQIPKSEGINMDQWLEYFDNVGIAFINSAEEGNEDSFNRGDSVNKFNQFQAIDMSLSQSIGQYISILQKIENMVDSLSGVSPQAEGQIFASETATGVKTAITQSQFVLEPYFFIHEDTKRRVLQQLLHLSTYSFKDNDKIKYITDDRSIKFINFRSEDLILSEVGVFVTNSFEDINTIQSVKQMAMAALQAGNAKVSEVIDVFMVKSLATLKEKIIQNEDRQTAISQQQQEKLLEIEREKIALEKEKMDREDKNKQLDRDKDIQVATLKALGFSNDADVNKNNINDIIEQEKIASSNMQNMYNLMLKNKKIETDKEISDKKLSIEKYKTDTQLEIARENKNKYDE